MPGVLKPIWPATVPAAGVRRQYVEPPCNGSYWRLTEVGGDGQERTVEYFPHSSQPITFLVG